MPENPEKIEQSPGPSLRESMERATLAAIERDDVVVELREAERSRLEILRQRLDRVAKEISDQDQFPLAILPGEKPRLWVDATSHVVMGRDKRIYRFLKDTRLGRTIILETDQIDRMAERISDYIAERLLEKVRAMESDPLAAEDLTAKRPESSVPAPKGGFLRSAAWFLLGAIVGGAALVAFAWFAVLPQS